jgi:hypothetical protein
LPSSIDVRHKHQEFVVQFERQAIQTLDQALVSDRAPSIEAAGYGAKANLCVLHVGISRAHGDTK